MEKILCNTTNTMQKMDTPTKEKISGAVSYTHLTLPTTSRV